MVSHHRLLLLTHAVDPQHHKPLKSQQETVYRGLTLFTSAVLGSGQCRSRRNATCIDLTSQQLPKPTFLCG